MVNELISELKKLKNPEKIKVYQWFFKTKSGEYGAGDKFLGLSSLEIKKIVANYRSQINLADIKLLLKNDIHEVRMAGVRILVYKYQTASLDNKRKVFNFYLKNSKLINNWDLVDVSAAKIVGDFLLNHATGKIKDSILLNLAASKNLWQRRIAIISTFEFIRCGRLTDTFRICRAMLADEHDLIHKACGWMLREAGKRHIGQLKKFLNANIKKMPRTMLRYAIEKFPEKERKFYLNKK